MMRWSLFGIILICTATLAIVLRPTSEPSVNEKGVVHPVIDSTEPHRSTSQSGSRDAQKRLLLAQSRLDALKQSLSRVNQALDQPNNSSSIEKQIAEFSAQEKDLRAQLDNLQYDSRSVDQNARAYESAHMAGGLQTQIGLEQQIQDVDSHIIDVQNRIDQFQATTVISDLPMALQPLKSEEARLEALKDSLRSQIRTSQLGTQETSNAVALEASSEENEVYDERDQVQRKLIDVRAELDYWRKQAKQSAATQQEQAARISELKTQIARQQQTVESLKAQSLPNARDSHKIE